MTGRKLRKPFYPLDEVCQRLEMLPSDLEPFVLHGHLKLSIPAADFWVNVGAWVEVEEGNRVRSPEGTAIVRGLLDLVASDAWRVLRHGATKVERFDAGPERYMEVWGGSEPFADHEVLKADLVVRDTEVSRFEAEHVPPAADAASRGGPGQRGAMPKYDWDAFWREVARSILFDGVPESQAAFVRRMVDWFDTRGEAPDPSTIKKKLSPLWRDIAPEAERKIA
ncbi:hypothetical protein [Falsiroseomonas ponticola]|uniref:hypothetical protein n=1 Tax=Falsiroseomonas ponticola TaxID=2786951 RepID=UPI001933A834|nr:hypothetical protein [Roseomonas ponticola]